MPPPAEGFAARVVLGPALRTQPDRRLVSLVRDGYEIAFDEIVRRYGKPLGRYAAAIVGGRAEDITQDAFSKALLALRRDDAEIDLRPWLYRIVRNTALNDLRDRPADAEELAEAIAGGRTPAEVAEQREELTGLMKRLRELPEPQRAAIVMRELEGLSHEEIATALGLSGGAARQAIYRARQALRDGAGLLLPLPLLRFLLDNGADVATAGTGAGAAAASVGGIGTGGAMKAGVVAAVLAGSVGTGVALQEHRGERGGPAEATAAETAPAARVAEGPSTVAGLASATSQNPDDSHGKNLHASGQNGGSGHREVGGDGRGLDPGTTALAPGPHGHHGHREPPRGDRGQRGPGPRPVRDGHQGPRGPRPEGIRSGDGTRGPRGPHPDGGRIDASKGSGDNSGPGSGSDSPPPPDRPPPDSDSSGPGDGSRLEPQRNTSADGSGADQQVP